MAQGVNLYVGIAALQIVILYWVASGFEFIENCPDGRNAITGKRISIQVLCGNSNSGLEVELARTDEATTPEDAVATELAVGYALSEGDFNSLNDIKERIPVMATEQAVDIAPMVGNMKVVFPKSLCSAGKRKVPIELLLRVMIGGTEYKKSLTTLQLYCKKPKVGLHITCPRGLGIKPSEDATPLEDFCGDHLRAVALIPGDWPTDGWRIMQNDLNVLGNDIMENQHKTSNSRIAVDVTEAAKAWTINVPVSEAGRCDNRRKAVKFVLTNGILFDKFFVKYTVLCSFDGVDILIQKSSGIGESIVDVSNGDIGSLMSDVDFQIKLADGSEDIPPLVYKDDIAAPFLITAFLTDRSANDLACKEGSDDISHIQATDRVLCAASFSYNSGFAAAKGELMECLQDTLVTNLCDQRTLVIDVDTIRTMTDENHCNNFFALDFNFECPESEADDSSTFEILPNPFSANEIGVVLRLAYEDKFHIYNTRKRAFRRVRKSEEDSLDMFGYGRLMVLLKYISAEVESCLEDETPANDKVNELENLLEHEEDDSDEEEGDEGEEEGEEGEEGAEADLPDWMSDIENLMDDIEDLNEEEAENKEELEKSINDLMANLISQAEANGAETEEEQALSGIMDAFDENINEKTPSKDACEVIDQLDNMSEDDDDDDMAKWLGHLWINMTLNNGEGCGKNILTVFLKHKRNPEDDESNTETCKPKLFRCINKIKRSCHSVHHTDTEVETDIPDGMESVCKMLELSKLMKLQARSLQFFDLRKKMANRKGSGLEKDKCAHNRLELKPRDVVAFKVSEDGILKAGTKQTFGKKWRWNAIATAHCDQCDDDDYYTNSYYDPDDYSYGSDDEQRHYGKDSDGSNWGSGGYSGKGFNGGSNGDSNKGREGGSNKGSDDDSDSVSNGDSNKGRDGGSNKGSDSGSNKGRDGGSDGDSDSGSNDHSNKGQDGGSVKGSDDAPNGGSNKDSDGQTNRESQSNSDQGTGEGGSNQDNTKDESKNTRN